MQAAFDVARARFNMIEQQIRPWDVLDQDVLDLLAVVKREEFVPPLLRALAFTDMEIPLGHGASMWSPKMEARILQELQCKAHDRALEIGAGSGYFAALLAHRCHSVLSLEIQPALKAMAQQNLKAAGLPEVRVLEADGARGYGEETYDVIVLSGSTPVLPDSLLAQLKPGGRLFAVVGDAPVMEARLYTRSPAGSGVATVNLFETVVAPLTNAAQPPRFKF
ncbi:MAG TPA: protein-L-isoaspartate O-methyltransferase [Burkholderiales bacterium]|jgi:protein-L-isoaspartate(D-aspartate) O-methyltransferase|nr:protein-L-isoaspartate O-methyltransferase [Burkholderiales bacterium]